MTEIVIMLHSTKNDTVAALQRILDELYKAPQILGSKEDAAQLRNIYRLHLGKQRIDETPFLLVVTIVHSMHTESYSFYETADQTRAT